MRCRVNFLLRTYLWTMLVFIIAKMAFLFFCREGHDFSITDTWQVITHGLTLDLSTALYILIIPFLLTIVSIWWDNRKAIKRILFTYFVIIAIALALAFVADTSLYPFWGFKLDASCLQYLSTPKEATASVSVFYLILRLLAFFLTAVLIGFGYKRALWLYIEAPRQQTKLPSVIHKISETVFYLICIPLIIIGIRGGLDESTTNIGQVYYSQVPFLNHAAVNPVFSFFSSLEKTSSYIPDYHFMEEEERAHLMEGLYPTQSINPDTLLRNQRPNIIVILLESCGGIFTEDIGGRKDIMPNLNRLVEEGVYFSNFYANSYRTDRGTLCTWSGYPSFPRSSVMKMPAKTRFLPGIARSLQQEGYKASYIYGGDINFTNMRGYLVTIGFERFLWMKDYSSKDQETATWGVRDDITFGTLYDEVTHFDTDSHYLIGYSTLSSHEPWDVPTHRLKDEIPNAFNYLDECLGNFINKVRQTPQWDNLLIVLLPDHGFSYFGVGEEHELHDHVPMLWLGGALKEPRRIEQLCNQTDLPATLLGQLGLTHDDYPFSRDVLSSNYTYPFATHTYNNGITMKDSTGFVVYDLNANRLIVNKSTDGERLIRKGMAILQTASEHINQFGTQK
ncbi:MAG: sulfatase-like hydrolase/transferase [Prevotella sp.]|nr:sulfatase-like hydrolase/transferase [Prevotella sp.]